MWQTLLEHLLNFFQNIGDFINWLTTEIAITDSIRIAPIEIVGIGGFAVIIGFWIFKLVDPFA